MRSPASCCCGTPTASADALARATVRWWILAVVWLLVLVVPSIGAPPEATIESLEEILGNVAASTLLGYWAQWARRAAMFAWQLQANLLGLPTVIALMMTGMLAQRAGWLSDLQAPAWKWAARIGLVLGLPAGIVYGAWSVTHAQLAEGLAMPAALVIALTAGLTLAFFYAATFLRHAPAPLIAWLAPAGRMALTNYLLQSLAMGLLLAGWGLGLGAVLGYAQLAVVALAIFVLQAAASRWWLAHFTQGPIEALWRAWTYRAAEERLPPAA
jgi:uncharacterized protein